MNHPSLAQTFGDIQIVGQANHLVINQSIQLTVAKRLPFNAASPYIGLARFEQENKDYFFGRDAMVGKLIEQISKKNLLLVIGRSGIGKSSLVCAGLIPQLACRLPQGRFRSLVIKPDSDPFAALRSELLSLRLRGSQLTEVRSDAREPLGEVLERLRPREQQWLLVVDQFEEIFTLCSDGHARARFLDGLVKLGSECAGDIRVVLAMRADLFEHLSSHPELARLTESSLCIVTPLEPSELRAAIEQPAAMHGVVFEAGLVEQIIERIQGRPGALPLLQYTLDLLWHTDHLEKARTLSIENYNQIGRVEGALRRRADTIFRYSTRAEHEERSAADKEAFRRIFLRLVDLTSQGADARIVSKRTLLTAFAKEDQHLIYELVEEKLLVTDSPLEYSQPATASPLEHSKAATVELAHEALLDNWPQLAEWIAQAREALYLRNRLSASTRHYAEARTTAQAEDELWRGTILDLALERRDNGDFDTLLGGLNNEESIFLEKSFLLRQESFLLSKKRREEAIQARRRRIGVVAVVALLVILGLIYGLAESKIAKERMRQQLLVSYVERGRQQLLFGEDRFAEALPWLQRARTRGATDPFLPDLLGEAMRSTVGIKQVFVGHSSRLSTATFSPTGQRIVTASDDHTARIWDVNTGQQLALLRGHPAAVRTAEYSLDGRWILTSSVDKTARVWDPQSGTQVAVLQGHTAAVTSASFSLDVRSIVTSSYDSTARVWEAGSFRTLLELKGHTSSVNSAAFSPDGRQVVTASEDHTAKIWDAATGRLQITLNGHTRGVLRASFSPEGRRIVTVGSDKSVRIWDAENGRQLIELGGHPGGVNTANFSPNGLYVVTAGPDPTARVWDAFRGNLLAELKGHSESAVWAAYSLDGQNIVTASADQTARVWNANSGPLQSVFALDGTYARSTALSPDGRRIITTSIDNTARVWDVESGRLLRELKGHKGRLGSTNYSPDGRRIVTASDDLTVKVWDAESGHELKELDGFVNHILFATFSPDGRVIATTSRDRTLRFYQATSGLVIREIPLGLDWAFTASYSPDGARIITASHEDKSTRVWDVNSGSLMGELQGHAEGVLDGRFSPDGQRIVTAHSDGTAMVWAANDLRLLMVLRGHTGAVHSASFSPDGRHIVTGSSDNTARIWDAEAGRMLSIFRGHTRSVLTTAYSPDGLQLLTSSEDGTARLWSAAPATRSAAEMDEFLRCFWPLRFDGYDSDVLVPNLPLPTDCKPAQSPR